MLNTIMLKVICKFVTSALELLYGYYKNGMKIKPLALKEKKCHPENNPGI